MQIETAPTDDRQARSNALRLAAAQALAGANATVIFATGAIVGATLSPDKTLATLPLTLFVVGMAGGAMGDGRPSSAGAGSALSPG